jgi:hypothetical protein
VTARQFEPGDIVVGHSDLLRMSAHEDGYSFGEWTRTRMRVISRDGNDLLLEAIDERPDRAVLLENARRRGDSDKTDPQDVIMCWPTRHVVHAD